MDKKKIKLAILIGVGLVSAAALVMGRKGGTPSGLPQGEVPLSGKENDFGYDEVVKAYETARESGELDGGAHGPDNGPYTEAPLSTGMDNDPYAQENDPRFRAMQEQIQKMERNAMGGPPLTEDRVHVATGTKTEAEREAEYRQRLLEARDAKRARSRDYSRVAPTGNESGGDGPEKPEFRCSIYRDQYILPGDRVTLLLTRPLVHKGNVFERNTLVYATANIQGNRVLLDITNINHVPVALQARDLQDGELGLYSPRAGELWREFQDGVETGAVDSGVDRAARGINVPLVGPAITAFSKFFSSRKYRDRDKIFLLNDQELILTLKNE